MNTSYDRLMYMEENINKNGGFSYNKLDELNKEGLLDEILDSLFIDEMLEKELSDFLLILNSKEFDNHSFLRKILLYESDLIKTFRRFDYVLSLHFNNKEAYRVFPLLFLECVKYFKLPGCDKLTLDKVESTLIKYIDFETAYNPNANRVLTEISNKPMGLYTDYSLYDEKLNSNKPINFNDSTEFFVWSEYFTYKREISNASKYVLNKCNNYVRWVSRYNGDGFGYDILSYDFENNREKLIEVKSGIGKNFELTETEYRVLNRCINTQNSDYYIYRYYYNYDSNELEFTKLIYDKEKNIFVDVDSPNNIYHLSYYFNYDNNRTSIKAKVVPEVEYQKLLRKS